MGDALEHVGRSRILSGAQEGLRQEARGGGKDEGRGARGGGRKGESRERKEEGKGRGTGGEGKAGVMRGIYLESEGEELEVRG